MAIDVVPNEHPLIEKTTEFALNAMEAVVDDPDNVQEAPEYAEYFARRRRDARAGELTRHIDEMRLSRQRARTPSPRPSGEPTTPGTLPPTTPATLTEAQPMGPLVEAQPMGPLVEAQPTTPGHLAEEESTTPKSPAPTTPRNRGATASPEASTPVSLAALPAGVAQLTDRLSLLSTRDESKSSSESSLQSSPVEMPITSQRITKRSEWSMPRQFRSRLSDTSEELDWSEEPVVEGFMPETTAEPMSPPRSYASAASGPKSELTLSRWAPGNENGTETKPGVQVLKPKGSNLVRLVQLPTHVESFGKNYTPPPAVVDENDGEWETVGRNRFPMGPKPANLCPVPRAPVIRDGKKPRQISLPSIAVPKSYRQAIETQPAAGSSSSTKKDNTAPTARPTHAKKYVMGQDERKSLWTQLFAPNAVPEEPFCITGIPNSTFGTCVMGKDSAIWNRISNEGLVPQDLRLIHEREGSKTRRIYVTFRGPNVQRSPPNLHLLKTLFLDMKFWVDQSRASQKTIAIDASLRNRAQKRLSSVPMAQAPALKPSAEETAQIHAEETAKIRAEEALAKEEADTQLVKARISTALLSNKARTVVEISAHMEKVWHETRPLLQSANHWKIKLWMASLWSEARNDDRAHGDASWAWYCTNGLVDDNGQITYLPHARS